MRGLFETIGQIDWYKQDKGFGVLLNLHDGREYFIHHSKLSSQYKQLLNKGDIVKFAPNYDQDCGVRYDRSKYDFEPRYVNNTH